LSDFKAISPVSQDEAKTVLELIRKPLINSGSITIVDNLETSAAAKQNKSTADIARSLNAAFYIEGSLSGSSTEKILVLRVVNTLSGEPSLQSDYTIVKMDVDTQKAGEAIVNALKGYTDISYEDIKRMSDNEEWENVLKNISNYVVQYPNKDKVRIEQLKLLASKKTAEHHYQRSTECNKNLLFKEATQSINLAISYDPANQGYRKYAAVISANEKEYKRKNEKLMIQSAKEFIEEGKLKSASDVLDRIESNDSEAIKLRSLLRDELEIIAAYDRAVKLYDDNKYSLARSAMQLPLKKKSDNPEYKQFIARIEKREKEQADRIRIMNETVSFYKDLTVFSLFVKPKDFKHYEGLGYIHSDYAYLDKNNFLNNASTYGKEISMHGVEASVFWHNSFPSLNTKNFPVGYDLSFLKKPWDFFKIKYTIIGSLVFSGNTDEVESTLNAKRSIETTTLFGTRATAAVGPSLSMYAFLIGGGLCTEMGYLLDSVENNPLFSGDKAVTKNYSYFQAGIGYSLWFEWFPFDNTHIFARWSELSTGLFGSQKRTDKNSFQNLSIGIGTRLF